VSKVIVSLRCPDTSRPRSVEAQNLKHTLNDIECLRLHGELEGRVPLNATDADTLQQRIGSEVQGRSVALLMHLFLEHVQVKLQEVHILRKEVKRIQSVTAEP
jgi:hypothetical protein